VARLSELLESDGEIVSTRKDINQWSGQIGRVHKLLYVLRYPFLISRYFYHAIRFLSTLNPLGKGIVMRSLRSPVIDIYLNEFIKYSKSNLVLLDQGSLQNIWSIAAFSKSFGGKALKALFNVAIKGSYYPHVYVYLNSSTELAVSRVIQRRHGDSRFDDMDRDAMSEGLRISSPVMCHLAEMLKSSESRLLVLDAELDIDEKAKQIIDFFALDDANSRLSF
jgi:hypothetical protein